MASRFTSKQSASQTLPAYMLRRQNFPGPWIGGISCACIGPFDIAGGDSARFCSTPAHGPRVVTVSPGSPTPTSGLAQTIYVGNGRLLAISWYARAVSGAGVTLALTANGIPNSGTGTIAMLNTTIDLNASPSGIAYVDDTASTYYVLHDDKAASTIDAAYSSPDWNKNAVSGTTPVWLRVSLTGGGQTASDVSVVIWYMTTSHINADKAND